VGRPVDRQQFNVQSKKLIPLACLLKGKRKNEKREERGWKKKAGEQSNSKVNTGISTHTRHDRQTNLHFEMQM
jgi:hypothetical protein